MFRRIGFEPIRQCGIAMAEYTLGHAKESQQALDELIATHAQYSAYQIAEVYAWRGEKDNALEWSQRAYTQHDDGLSDIKIDPQLATLRTDARYASLLKKFGVAGIIRHLPEVQRHRVSYGRPSHFPDAPPVSRIA